MGLPTGGRFPGEGSLGDGRCTGRCTGSGSARPVGWGCCHAPGIEDAGRVTRRGRRRHETTPRSTCMVGSGGAQPASGPSGASGRRGCGERGRVTPPSQSPRPGHGLGAGGREVATGCDPGRAWRRRRHQPDHGDAPAAPAGQLHCTARGDLGRRVTPPGLGAARSGVPPCPGRLRPLQRHDCRAARAPAPVAVRPAACPGLAPLRERPSSAMLP